MSSTDHTPTTPEAEDDIIEGQAEVKEAKPSPAASPSSTSKTAAPSQAEPGGRLGRWLVGLCAVGALLLAGYASWQFYNLSSYDDAEKARYEAELSSVTTQLADLSQRVAAYDAAITGTRSAITALDEAIARLAEQEASNTVSDHSIPSPEAVMIIILTDRLLAGGDVSYLAPLISLMPALSHQAALDDILSLAGQSSHQSLRQEAKSLWDAAEGAAEDAAPLSGLTGWFADLVKLQPITGTVPEVDSVSAPDPFDPTLSLSALVALVMTQDTEQAALWLAKARARIEAETKAHMLIQAVMLSQQEDAS